MVIFSKRAWVVVLNDQQNKSQIYSHRWSYSFHSKMGNFKLVLVYRYCRVSFSNSKHILPITSPISLQMSMLCSVINLKEYWIEVVQKRKEWKCKVNLMVIFIGTTWESIMLALLQSFLLTKAFILFDVVMIFTVSSFMIIWTSVAILDLFHLSARSTSPSGYWLYELHQQATLPSSFLFDLTNQRNQQEMGNKERRENTGFGLVIFLFLFLIWK